MKYLGIYGIAFLVMFLLDMLWLGVVATDWYARGIGHLMAPSPNLWAAALFYLLYPLGLLLFCVLPGRDAPWLRVLGMGALFGFFAYATYDLTNLATLKGWPPVLTVVDIAWGCVVSGLSAAAGKYGLDAMK